jgi:hypothetical protein
MVDDQVSLSLSSADVALLIEALDSHEYWQLSDPTWRHSGYVRLPGDWLDPWGDAVEPTPEQRDAIDEIETCRRLQDALRAGLRPSD